MDSMDVEQDGFVLISHQEAGRLAGENPVPEYLSDISKYIDSISQGLWPVNKKIHDNPELNYEERIAHEALTSYMEKQKGWKVTRSAYGLETAWVAVFDSGKKGPVISFNAEMDALPGIGHACGHNLIASASVSGALATGEMMRRFNLKGKVVLFGTPAEEGGGGKIKLLEAGAYRDHNVDLNLISHPGITTDCALMRTTAYTRFSAVYHGRETHAAANPWLGINALDALVSAYSSFSMLRQQTMPGDIIQGHITDGGLAPNIIHARAAGVFVVRANLQSRLDVLRKKVDRCFEGGALATGAKLEVEEQQAYRDHVPNRVMARSYTRYWNSLNPPNLIPEDQDVDEIQGRSAASTDQGDISYAMPSLSAGFAIAPGPQGNGPHSPDFTEAAGTKDAFERSLRVGKALAGTAIDVLTQDGLLEQIKEQWKKDLKDAGSAGQAS